MTFLIISMLRDVMTIPNALAFARNYQIPNTKLSPPLLLHCAILPPFHCRINRPLGITEGTHFLWRQIFLSSLLCTGLIGLRDYLGTDT